ncbi:hypothetical protein Ms3S1_04930 [Methylosinus sp. 3S-1]|uniref:Uncharacterized protein n=1 Tax=Methylosinus trichosporium (strain ATCC 35070 / NCIMB 11131 / UNIQEM 75 / OB3b) TaxID=595536 RepID=A0A2D2CVV1_METT3|nr:hypothetical protein CQW49_02485 [Methylosinus trichosporium OB3b]OBS54149.1 hypothetical protein A8B73_02655 [Methylosinus sp. 3S-1]
MTSKAAKPAASGADRPRNDHVGALIGSEIAQSLSVDQAKIPSRATLARRWPGLRLNRYTGRWRDDATGAQGDDFATLSAYLREAR